MSFSPWKKWRSGKSQASPPKQLLPIWRRWRKLSLEPLEPRLAPADLTYVAPDAFTGSNLTLRVAAHDAANWLQIVDNQNAAAVLQEVQLTADRSVQITGALVASDVLTVDFSFGGAAAPHNITVNFDGGGPDVLGLINDKVLIAGAGSLYQPQSFSLQANDDITVTGNLSTVGDITLTSQDTETGALDALLVNVLATSPTAVTVDGGTLTGANITLAANAVINVNRGSCSPVR